VAPLVAALEAEHGFETDVRHLTVFGRCGTCRSAQSPAQEAAGSSSA
jgi:Fur family ferric uptake transcriptional regulator